MPGTILGTGHIALNKRIMSLPLGSLRLFQIVVSAIRKQKMEVRGRHPEHSAVLNPSEMNEERWDI